MPLLFPGSCARKLCSELAQNRINCPSLLSLCGGVSTHASIKEKSRTQKDWIYSKAIPRFNKPHGAAHHLMHTLGAGMEDASEESEMGRTGINWALAVCPVLISTVQERISHLQSSLHSTPVWEGNCTSPFSKQGGETRSST